jgi:hypothetical protein
MAIKKVPYCRQPSIFVSLMFSLLLQESISFDVFFLCPFCSKRISFGLFTIPSNKFPSFTHLGSFKVAMDIGSS